MPERPEYEDLVHQATEAEKKLSECRDAGVALEKDKEQYRTIVETQTEFIVRCKADGTRTFVNEAYLRHFGLTREQAIGLEFPASCGGRRPAVHPREN